MFRSLWKRRRDPKPLVSHDHDIRLLQRLRARHIPGWQACRHIAKILDPRERRMLTAAIAVFVISSVWFAVALFGQYRIAIPAVGGRYLEGVVGVPELPNPLFASVNDVDTDIVRLVYSGLLRADGRERLVPDLAASYEVSADKKTYTFALRRDVRWHDGEPFTAQDVLYTFETIQHPLVNSPLFAAFQGVTVYSVDEYTVRFTLKEPFAPFLASMTVGILPEHLWGTVPPERMRLLKYNLQPVGTGPYLFRKLLKDETGHIYRYEFARNPLYHRQPPYIEEFSIQFFGDYEGQTGAIQAMREEKIDGLNFVPHDLRDRVERKHIALHTLELPQYTAIFLNAGRQSALQDAELREALERAIHKERILREAVKGEGVVLWGPLLPGFPGYEASVTTTPYDGGKANELLDRNWPRISPDAYRESRFKELAKEFGPLPAQATSTVGAVSATSTDGGDSALAARLVEEMNPAQTFYRKGKDGTILRLSLVTADTSEYRQAAALIAGFWQEVGIATEVRHIAPKDLARLALKHREYDAFLYGVIIGSDPDQYPFWHSSQAEYPGLNFSRYANRAVDALLERARGAADDAAAAAMHRAIGVAITKDRPAIFLFAPTYTYATADRILGVPAARVFHPADRLDHVAQWYIKTKGKWKF